MNFVKTEYIPNERHVKHVVVEDWRNVDNIEMRLITDTGHVYRMLHYNDCCENVYIEDIVGDMEDIIGDRLVVAERRTSTDDPPPEDSAGESWQWTFYELRTVKASSTIRWYGESTYYSVEVSFEKAVDRYKPDYEYDWVIAGYLAESRNSAFTLDEHYRAYFELQAR